MTRQEVFDLAYRQYAVAPEYLWDNENAVLRRRDNRKWFAAVLRVPGEKLGIMDKEMVDILNVKSDPVLIGSLHSRAGYFGAYHMNKENWISILLGKEELDESIRNLLSLSYDLTAPKKRGSGLSSEGL